jgi:hypothetical protein
VSRGKGMSIKVSAVSIDAIVSAEEGTTGKPYFVT